jgi:tRNA (guanine6-N2)-methyltransferase
VHESHLPVLARTRRGIEWIARAEVRARLGVSKVALGHRELRFSVPELTPELLELGTVDDVFLVAAELDGAGRRRESLARVAAVAADLDLDGLAGIVGRAGPRTFDVVGSFLGKRNFSRFELEDAVGGALAAASGWSYRSRSGGAPARGCLSLRVHLADSLATLAVRIADAPLHRRAYRVASIPGSLHPPLARALALLAGLGPGATLVDPFCGAGTIPIEAKLACPGLQAVGFDLDPAALDATRRNVEAAAAPVVFAIADAAALPIDDRTADRIATNPPWGAAVGAAGSLASDPASFTAELLRALAPGGRVVVLAPPPSPLGRAARTAMDVLLECRVRVSGAVVSLLVLGRRGDEAEPIDAGGLYGEHLGRG